MKKCQINQIREQVYIAWIGRPQHQRRSTDVLQFVDEMWATGFRLASNQGTHYQYVMDVIRMKIEN